MELKALHTGNAGVVISFPSGYVEGKKEQRQAGKYTLSNEVRPLRRSMHYGVLGKYTLGIDMFSRDPNGIYPDTPEDLKEELLKRIEDGEIETLLFTHEHGDHFCLEDVLEVLRRNSEICIISTAEVIRRIRAVEKQAGRMYAVDPAETGNVKIELPGISMEVFNSKHMGEEYAGVQNLTCMLRIGDQRLLVPGDAWPEPELFARVSRWSKEIDWLLAPFPLVGLLSTRRMMVKSLEVKHILAFHLPRPEMDVQNWTVSAKTVCERARDGLPVPVFGEELGREVVL